MIRTPAVPAPRELSPAESFIGAGVVVATVGVAAAFANGPAGRAAVAVVTGGVLAYVCVRSPRQGVYALLGWLALVGLTRRLATEVLADPDKDPLLLVAPFASGLLCARALVDGAARARGWLANGIAAFSVVTVVAVVNPRQDGILVGLAGLLIWLAPMLWFWIGRRYVDARLGGRVIDGVGIACVVASAYGLVQFLGAFPPWDQRWIDERGYLALYIGPDTVRPFGLSASAAEFAIVAAFGCLWAGLAAVRAFRRHERGVALVVGAAAALAGAALVLSAVRTVLAWFVVAALVVYLVRRRGRWWVPVVVALAGLGAVFAAAQLVDVESIPSGGASASARRIVALVRDPFGDRYEVTTGAHVDLIRDGVEEGFRRPLGSGTGSTNRGADQFGAEGASRNREFDLANAGVAFGVVGMVLVVWITVAALVVSIRRARVRPDLAHLAVVGLLVTSLGNWWNGGHYLMAPLLWLLIGWLDAPAAAAARKCGPVAEPEVTASG